MSSAASASYSDRPRFIDFLAVDLVVSEQCQLKLTPSEKRHAAHRMARSGIPHKRIAEVMRVTFRTVERLLEIDPPLVYDIGEDGEFILLRLDKRGQYVSVEEDSVAV